MNGNQLHTAEIVYSSDDDNEIEDSDYHDSNDDWQKNECLNVDVSLCMLECACNVI